MRAVILAGGLGTRLRPYTFTIPKPLMPLGDRAVIDHLVDQLRRHPIDRIILSLGYHADTVRAYCGDGRRYGIPIDYVEETTPLGTAGCLALARPLLDPERPFLLMNGDIVTSLDFSALAAFHECAGATLTIGYVEHTYTSPFGVLKFDGDDVVDIVEKPSVTSPVSAGIYCLSPGAAAFVRPDAALTMPELALRLRAAGHRVVGYRIREFWRALETRDHFDDILADQEFLQMLEGARPRALTA